MSSSRIIKSGQLRNFVFQEIEGDCFAELAVSPGIEPDADGFAPLLWGSNGFPAARDNGSAPEEELADEPAPLRLPEGMHLLSGDELQQRLDESCRQGMEEGRRQAERGLANVFRALREAVDEVTLFRDRLLRESEEDLLKLAVMVARKVIQQEVTLDRRILANVIGAAIGSCTDRDRVVLRLNPGDLTLVNGNRDIYLAGVGDEAQLTLVSDESLHSGGCLVEASTGTVDARIEAQLEEIFRRMMEESGLPEVSLPGPVVEVVHDAGEEH